MNIYIYREKNRERHSQDTTVSIHPFEMIVMLATDKMIYTQKNYQTQLMITHRLNADTTWPVQQFCTNVHGRYSHIFVLIFVLIEFTVFFLKLLILRLKKCFWGKLNTKILTILEKSYSTINRNDKLDVHI